MNLFETETWRAFFPNFIAVVASIVLTFGTDRAIQEYNHRQDIREVIAVLKADARESFEYYRETADNCRRICSSTDRIVRAGDRYDTLPPEMLGKFLMLLLEKNVFTSTSASEDILKQSGTMQYMEPELLSVIDDIRLAENSINDAIAGCVSDMETIRTGLYMDSRRFPEALRDTLPSGEGAVAAVRFVMGIRPATTARSKIVRRPGPVDRKELRRPGRCAEPDHGGRILTIARRIPPSGQKFKGRFFEKPSLIDSCNRKSYCLRAIPI